MAGRAHKGPAWRTSCAAPPPPGTRGRQRAGRRGRGGRLTAAARASDRGRTRAGGGEGARTAPRGRRERAPPSAMAGEGQGIGASHPTPGPQAVLTDDLLVPASGRRRRGQAAAPVPGPTVWLGVGGGGGGRRGDRGGGRLSLGLAAHGGGCSVRTVVVTAVCAASRGVMVTEAGRGGGGGLLPAPGSLSSALRSRYRSNWPQWRRAPASHPARPAHTRRNSPPGPPVKRRATPLAFPQPAPAHHGKPIGGDTCLSSRASAQWLLRPRLPS